MPYNTTASLDKLTCTEYVDFGKSSDRFGRFSWTKNDSNYLYLKLKVFKREDKNAELRLRQNRSMGEADFNQFTRQRNQLVVAADNFLREQSLSPVLQSTLSKDMEEQLKLVHKVIDLVDRSNRRICVTLLRNKEDNPRTAYAQVRLIGRKKEEEKFQQIVYVNYKLEEFMYLHDVTNSVYDEVIANKPICNVLQKLVASIYSFILCIRVRMSWNIEDNKNLFLKLKTKLGLYHVELKSKDSREKITLTLVGTQQLPDIEKTDSKDEVSCLKWTIYNGRKKVCINFQTDTDKVNIVVYRYRNSMYLKDTERDLKLTEYKKILAKRVFLLCYIDIFYKRCIVLDETTVHN